MTALDAARRRVSWNDTPAHADDPAVISVLTHWEQQRQAVARILGDDPPYIHFTSEADAHRIATSCELHCSSVIADAVYAVAAGGSDVPGTQQGTHRGFGNVTGERTHAIVFHTDEHPDTIWPEEVIWHRTTPLPIRNIQIVTRAAARTLLTGAHTDAITALTDL
jgi:hypothetical protein